MSGITHYAKVKEIKQYQDTNKKIIIFDGSAIPLSRTGRTPHQKNMEYLNRNISLKNAIRAEVIKFIKKFLQDVIVNKKGYMNSANVAWMVSKFLQLPHVNKYNLVGSMLFEEIEAYDCAVDGLDKNLTVIASKGDNQHYFDYFVDEKTVVRTR